MDSAHVPDLQPPSPERAAHRRLRRADGSQEALQEAQAVEAEGYGKDRTRLGTVSERGLLVHVEQFGHQNLVAKRWTCGSNEDRNDSPWRCGLMEFDG